MLVKHQLLELRKGFAGGRAHARQGFGAFGTNVVIFVGKRFDDRVDSADSAAFEFSQGAENLDAEPGIRAFEAAADFREHQFLFQAEASDACERFAIFGGRAQLAAQIGKESDDGSLHALEGENADRRTDAAVAEGGSDIRCVGIAGKGQIPQDQAGLIAQRFVLVVKEAG